MLPGDRVRHPEQFYEACMNLVKEMVEYMSSREVGSFFASDMNHVLLFIRAPNEHSSRVYH
jgi:hypothetical protein